jgi:thiol-disulfide isomerase/thioredoxin
MRLKEKRKLTMNRLYSIIDSAVFAFAVNAIPAIAAPQTDDIKIVKINDSNFEQEVLKSSKTVLLEISSTSCPPCLTMIPTIISIAKNHPEIKVASVGIDEPNLDKVKASLPIQAFPTFFIVKKGAIVNELVGATKEENLLNALGVSTNPTKKAPRKSVKEAPGKLTCTVNGQFGGLQNFVSISFNFADGEIKGLNLNTDVIVPPQLDRNAIMQKISASGKGEVTPTLMGFRIHNDMQSRFIRALDMKKTSTYGEMRAGLELQGFSCK